jgi:uncharacterized membrane protein
MMRNVSDWERVLSVAAGAALLTLAANRRAGRSALVWTGVGLVARGVTGLCPVNAALGRGDRRDDTRQALGGSRGIRVNERIVIAKPAAQLYAFWRDLRNLPHVISHLERVDVLDDGRSHWVVRGPAGIRVVWDAAIINEVPSELIAWRSLPGSDVASAGSVRFRPLAADATEVRVTFQYEPPAGKLGASLAWLAGQGPSALLRQDLRRLKQLLEHGSAPEIDQPSGRLSWLVQTP